MLESDEYVALSPRAKQLLIDVALQYNGFNNGALAAAWSYMRESRGWRSKSTLAKARGELVDAGFLIVTHYQGNLLKRSTYFAISWRAIDETKHTVDVKPTVTAPRSWRTKNIGPYTGRVNPTGGVLKVAS